MSLDLLTPQPEADHPKTAASPVKRRRRSTPGLSMLAHGEPMIWLTGGALSVCVFMIVGLLLLVLWFGLATFWPRPLVQLELLDGSVHMGEVTRRETFLLSEDASKNLSGEILLAAQQTLSGANEVPAKRRLLRTGNFQLTNEHFNWLSDFEIKPGGESTPEWALLVERVEWGRFYGIPQCFALLHRREIEPDEQQQLAILQFFDANRWRLTPEQVAAVNTATESIRHDYAQLRSRRVAEFLQPLAQSEGTEIQAVVAGQSMALDELSVDQDVSAAYQVWQGPAAAWREFERQHADVWRRDRRRHKLEKYEIGHVNSKIEEARLDLRQLELDHQLRTLVDDSTERLSLWRTVAAMEAEREGAQAVLRQIQSTFGDDSQLAQLAGQVFETIAADIEQQRAEPQARIDQLMAELRKLPPEIQLEADRFIEVNRVATSETETLQHEISQLREENARFELRLLTADGAEKTLLLSDIVRAYPANQLSLLDKLGIYTNRWIEFLTADPREANSEGGVFPAIWGTVAMTLIMSTVVVPFGVLSALYLREYAKAGLVVSVIRIAINNLAGVPSIVFGVFGLSFFCYRMGAFIDGGPANAGIHPWPAPSWFLLLAAVALVALCAFGTSLYTIGGPKSSRTPAKRLVALLSTCLWIAATVGFILILTTTPFFHGFYQAQLPNPYFGKGGLIWASLTLALLTLPVVIVATEEALAAVPNSLREGSYACGAGKWQTIRRIILPHALPGIMTGMILAMARGAGEVAPLMLVGAVKLAPELPVALSDWGGSLGPLPTGPFHFDRSFMHLGFHIYDLGFQSQNSEAAKPMVFTTTLLLIAIIALLNVVAVALRARLKKTFQSTEF